MYKSELHQILVDSLKGCTWTRSTKNEDNFRQVLCASIYKHISEDNVEIPSTYSGDGDVQLFERKVELKYSSVQKREKIESIIEDFELLLDSKIQFSIVAMRVGVGQIEDHLRRCVQMPKLIKTGSNPHFGVKAHKAFKYHQVSIFLASTFPHELKEVDDPSVNKKGAVKGKGNKSTSYLSFESAPSVLRSSFLKIHDDIIHVDVVGSREDGLVCFLFKRADSIKLNPVAQGVPVSIAIPYSKNPIEIAKATVCDAVLSGGKDKALLMPGKVTVEQNVVVFDIGV